MKKFKAKVKLCTWYDPPVPPDVDGMNVGDTVLVWKSIHNEPNTYENKKMVCIQLRNGKVIEMNRMFCRQHLEYI